MELWFREGSTKQDYGKRPSTTLLPTNQNAEARCRNLGRIQNETNRPQHLGPAADFDASQRRDKTALRCVLASGRRGIFNIRYYETLYYYNNTTSTTTATTNNNASTSTTTDVDTNTTINTQ